MRAALEPWFALRRCPACRVRPTMRDGVCARCRDRWLGADARRTGVGSADLAAADLIALGAYRGDLGRLVRAAKYRPDRRLLALLGTALGHRVHEAFADAAPDCSVVPVPGDRSRLRRRGLDHALLVATAVAAALGPRALLLPELRRVRSTRPQAGLSDAERSANLHGAIAWRQGALNGATVVLVDDVLTTGATARACRSALTAAGAGRVVVAVAARAR
ncbi:MAG: ComF family protein [Trueperaceae bacterium]